MTLIPYPDNPAALSETNPIFNDNSFVRGDEQRLNNQRIWANFTELDSVLERVETTYLFRGLINGRLNFDTASTLPILSSGVYEVNGKIIYKTSPVSIALTDTYFNNRKALEAFCHYLITMDESGNVKYLMYGEGVAQASQAVTNISGTTTKTLTVAAVPGSGSEIYTAYITGTGSFTGTFRATRASATTFTITLDTDLGSVSTGMNVVLYNVIKTRHGSGSLTGITTGVNVLQYTPSLGENGETDSFALWDGTKNGFYLTLSGLTNVRVLGSVATTSPVGVYFIFSYKSGRNKNDNWVLTNAAASLVTNAVRWTSLVRAWGCDYIFVDDGTVGSEVTIQRESRISARVQGWVTAALHNCAIHYDPNGGTTNTIGLTSNNQYGGHGVSGQVGNASLPGSLPARKGSLLKPLLSAITAADGRANFTFTMDII